MKLVRTGAPGTERPGLIDADGRIRDLSAHVADIAGSVLTPEGLARLAAIDPASLPLVEGDVRFGPCVGQVGKFLCIGLNYSDHAAESGMTVPPEPVLFTKATSAIVGPNDDVAIPRGSVKTDWEVELGIVIGAPAKYVSEEEAEAHIAGYCLINDVSEREYQLERHGTWDKGKGCDTFGPIGPWLATRDEIADPDNLKMWLEVNGHRYQDGKDQLLEYALGPWGQKTYMARIAPDGKVISFEQVLTVQKFASIKVNEAAKADVLRTIGAPSETSYLSLTDLEVWTYPYKKSDVWNSMMHVHFDKSGIVRKMLNDPDPRFDPDMHFPLGRLHH